MTAGVDPRWRLDRVAPAQMYPSDAAIMRRAMELTLAALPRGQGARLVPLSPRAWERFRVLGRLREARA
jgi:hypothetical protein